MPIGNFKKFMEDHKDSMEEFKAYVEKCDEIREEAVTAFNKKLEDNIESFEDLLMLIHSTSAFEWDPEFNAKYELDGRTVLVPVVVPKSILTSLEVKKYIKDEQGLGLDFDVTVQKMCYMLMARGILAAMKDSVELKPKILSAALMSIVRKMGDE